MPASIANRQKVQKVDLKRIRRSLHRLLKKMYRQEYEVSLSLVDDEQITEINRTYLKRDRPTNVISFAMTEGDFVSVNPYLLGDIIISVETALRDARRENIDFMDEMEFLLIHGLLHLIGFDHENTSSAMAEQMKAKEKELITFLGHGAITP